MEVVSGEAALDLGQLRDEALEMHRAGRLEEAEELFRKILAVQSQDLISVYSLGAIAAQAQRYETAVCWFDRALQIQPHFELASASRASCLQQLERLVAEQAAAQAAAQRELFNRYQELLELVINGRHQQAKERTLQLLAQYPTFGLGWKLLSVVASALNDHDQVLSSCQHAAKYLPEDEAAVGNLAKAYFNCGVVLQRDGSLEAAVDYYRRSLEVKEDAEVYNNLGCALQVAGRMEEALTALDRCLELAPDFYTARSNRGVSLKSVGRVEEAIAEFRCCLEVDPQNVSVLANYGFALQESEQIDEAIEIYRRCLTLSPDYIDVYINLGAVLKDDGQIEEAITCYRQCLAVDPKNAKARSNLLFCLNYDPKTDRERFFAEHCQWDDLHGLQFRTQPKGFGNEFLQEKKLRIGFVSGDFMRHPVGFLLLPIFTRLDRSGLEIYCYSTATGKDELTQRFMAAAHHWREVADLADEEFARVIEDDGIDILLDLAGHTAGNRLPVFARRPAPVQLSWLGYFATTGLKSMDYVIMDQHTVPAEMTKDFVEKVLYLPHSRFCFLPSEQTPEVAPLPALANGAITFGSFNNLTKINALVVGLWAAVLKAVPDSKLIVKWKGLESEQKRAEIVRAFAEHGVEAHRLELRGHSSHWEMLAQYGDVDIALDTYPFSGGMTSCLALWMGVPIVTLPGDRPVSRQTYAFLKNIGLDECVAADREDFVRKAVELAGNLERLAQLRTTLRERMQASPVCDPDGMAKNLEQLLREVWRRRCAVGGQ